MDSPLGSKAPPNDNGVAGKGNVADDYGAGRMTLVEYKNQVAELR